MNFLQQSEKNSVFRQAKQNHLTATAPALVASAALYSSAKMVSGEALSCAQLWGPSSARGD